jgi:hypothetical protein
LTVGSLVCTLAILEVVLRVAGVAPLKTGHQRMFVEYDATRGWRNIPNASGDYSAREYRVRIQYNSRGLRGSERPYAKPPGTYRIVVLGDSFIEGYSVAERDRVTEQLEEILNGAGGPRRVEAIALGTAGYSTDQELLWLESEGVKYEPDLVVLMFYFNDVWYNTQAQYWRGGKPLFVVNNGSLSLTNVPVPEPKKDTRARRGGRTAGEGVTEWWRSRSRLYAVAARAGAQLPWLSRATGGDGPAQLAEREDPTRVRTELSVFRRSPPPDVEQAWQVTRALLNRMNQVAQRSGARFVVFHIPFRASIYTDEWPVIKKQYGLSEEDWDVLEVRRRFLHLCGEGPGCIEPTERFAAAAAELARKGDRLYYRYDNHWNPRGHRLAAEILADYVSKNLAGRGRAGG